MNRTIIVEGPNGSGKTTLVEILSQWLPEYHVRPSRSNCSHMQHRADDDHAIARGSAILDRVEVITGNILAGAPPEWVCLSRAVIILCYPPLPELRKNCDYREGILSAENACMTQSRIRGAYLDLMGQLAYATSLIDLVIWDYTNDELFKTHQLESIIRLARGQ